MFAFVMSGVGHRRCVADLVSVLVDASISRELTAGPY